MAQQALSIGREEIAREALARRGAALSQADDLKNQQTALRAEEERLTPASRRLQTKVEAFRTHKETIKATYTAAEAQTRISESVTGISEEMGDVGLAIQRAEDKTAQLQARARALDELLASGALEDATLPAGRDDLQAQLDAIAAGRDIDEELARIRQAAAETGDAAAFAVALHDLLDTIRHLGAALAADDLATSELVLPSEDATLEEVRSLLAEEGLIPG